MKTSIALRTFSLTFLISCGGTEFYEKTVGTQNVSTPPDDEISFGHDDPGTGIDSGWGFDDPTREVKFDSFIYDEDRQNAPVDILFVVDNSGSMGNEQDALATNFDLFIQDFVQKGIDFNMSITTTDMRSGLAGEPVSGSMDALTYDKYLEDENIFFDDFSDMIRVGTSGSGYEKGLDGAKTFFENYGSAFVRPSSHLAVVYVSDEEDQSSQAVQDYIDHLKSLKSDSSKVQAHSIIRDQNLEGGSGVTSGGQRYIDVSTALNGSHEEITNNFAQTLSAIGTGIVTRIQNLVLGSVPNVSSIKVVVDGALQASGWSYNTGLNSIEFDQNSAPVLGAEIKVYYYEL